MKTGNVGHVLCHHFQFLLKNRAKLNVDRRPGRPLGSRQLPAEIERLQKGGKALLGISNSEEVDQKPCIRGKLWSSLFAVNNLYLEIFNWSIDI